MKQMKRKSAALLLALAVLCSGWLAACSAQSNGAGKTATAAGNSASAEYGAMDTADGAMPQAATEESAVATDAGGGGLNAGARPTDGEKLIENLYYEIETLQFDSSVEQIQSLYESLGGYVQESSVEGLSGQGLRSAHYVLRIPQEQASQLKERATGLGNVLRVDSSVQNVTDEYYDMEARLKSLRTQEERLLELLEQSGSLEDIVQLEQALSDVTYQIEKLTGTLRNYDSLIQYMTVTIDLREVTRETEVSHAPVTLGDRIAAQFRSTMAGLGEFGETVLIFVVGGLPVWILLAAVCLAVFLMVRLWKRSHKTRKEQPPEPLVDQPEEDPGEDPHTEDPNTNE